MSYIFKYTKTPIIKDVSARHKNFTIAHYDYSPSARISNIYNIIKNLINTWLVNPDK